MTRIQYGNLTIRQAEVAFLLAVLHFVDFTTDFFRGEDLLMNIVCRKTEGVLKGSIKVKPKTNNLIWSPGRRYSVEYIPKRR